MRGSFQNMLLSAGTKISTAFASGGRRFKDYVINLMTDYKTVITEAATEVREKPWKGVASASVVLGIVYAVKTNPDEQHFMATTMKHQSMLTLIGEPIRNPVSTDRVQSTVRLFNEHRLGRLNFILFSIIWRRDYSKECDLYAAQLKVLKPNWRDFPTRFIDVGVCGRWIFSELSMRQYDVNEIEFPIIHTPR